MGENCSYPGIYGIPPNTLLCFGSSMNRFIFILLSSFICLNVQALDIPPDVDCVKPTSDIIDVGFEAGLLMPSEKYSITLNEDEGEYFVVLEVPKTYDSLGFDGVFVTRLSNGVPVMNITIQSDIVDNTMKTRPLFVTKGEFESITFGVTYSERVMCSNIEHIFSMKTYDLKFKHNK